MSSREVIEKSREEVKAAREAKKLAKLKAKSKTLNEKITEPNTAREDIKTQNKSASQDEVDKAITNANCCKQTQIINNSTKQDKTRDVTKTERAAKKPSKQAKKKGAEEKLNEPVTDLTVKDVVNTLKDIVNVAKEVQIVTARVEAINLGTKKSNSVIEEPGKSKADLRAERRAKQEAQRAAKQASTVEKNVKQEPKKEEEKEVVKEEKLTKVKVSDKPKSQCVQKINWLGVNTLMEHSRQESLKNVVVNSNIHPAIVRLGVQLATHVVTGANAKCIALLDAMKQVVRDYSLPARTEFGRGLEVYVSQCAAFLWELQAPGASQLNALSHLRRHLTNLPADVHDFDAKKKLQEEIDRYIREQIDMAGEAISIAVRNKISDGDNILTYGCSSLIERVLYDAHAAGVNFRTIVVGCHVQPAAKQLLRRLLARGVPCSYVDISGITAVMNTVNKVILGAESLLANGAVLGLAGSLSTALAARAHNVPVLVACETHKFSDKVHTDTYHCDEIGDPEDLIDKNDKNSPLKDWKSNANLNLLNLLYDITPPSLVTAVVTELAIIPCTSAPVILRYKLSEYGI